MILLFGLPRSGTTWVGKILDSHPRTLYRHEPDSWRRIDAPLAPPLEEIENYASTLVDYAQQVTSLRGLKVSGKLPLFPKDYLTPWGFRTRQLWLLAAKVGARYLPKLEDTTIPDMIRLPDQAKVEIIWKSIESAGRLGLFAQLIPNSYGILLIRHPCGYISSMLRGEQGGQFVSNTPASEDYGVLEQLLETAPARRRDLDMPYLRSLTPIERSAWRWTLWNEKVMEDIQSQANCRVVRYEDFCAGPAREARHLFDFCGLNWQLQTEQFLVDSSGKDDSAYYSVYKDSSRASTTWRERLSAENIEKILAITSKSLPGALYPP